MVNPTTVGLSFLLETVFGTLWAWIVYGEKQQPTIRVIIAGSILIFVLGINAIFSTSHDTKKNQEKLDEILPIKN